MTKNEIIELHGKEGYEKEKERKKQYYKDNRPSRLEYFKEHYNENKDDILKRKEQYRKEHPEKIKEWRSTPMGRASGLVGRYKAQDKLHNRGECTLKSKWIVDNIFTSKCIYCGASGWEILGCDRINNELPHLEDNVVPCCNRCNTERGVKGFKIFLEQKQKEIGS